MKRSLPWLCAIVVAGAAPTMAAAGLFTEYHQLEPIYCRKPEAQRVWERTHGQ